VNEIGARQRQHCPDLVPHAVQQLRVNVDEDLEGDLLAKVPRPRPHDGRPGPPTEHVPSVVSLAEDRVRETQRPEGVISGLGTRGL
jgi:hypothetical protein